MSSSLRPANLSQPTTQATHHYEGLAKHFARMHRFQHLSAMARWDCAAMMPPGGHQARSDALAEISALLHELTTDPSLRGRIDGAMTENLSAMQRANLREMDRAYVLATALPDSLVRAKELATSDCEHAWRTQRAANDWAGFAPKLREVLRLVREEAQHLAAATGLDPYDALIDQYEPGMRCAQLDRIFNDVRSWLPGLIRDVIARQSSTQLVMPVGPFAIDKQRELCRVAMQMLEFDFNAGRLDESAHPFSGGVPQDVRMTTRYGSDDFLKSLMGTVHETGHGRYEQNLPRDWVDQPVSHARSYGIHESQSLSFEMQLGSHPAFAQRLAPHLRELFGDQPAFEPTNLWRLITHVQRGLIRVDADEVTYPAHVILRYDIERALIGGTMDVDDIPDAWRAGMLHWLDIDTQGNFRDGPMQDVHWPSGSFGYFPCYTLGAMYAAQWFAAMRRAMPDLDERLMAGDWSPVFDWLKTKVWEKGSSLTTDDLAREISGSTLDPSHFRSHLERRYLGR